MNNLGVTVVTMKSDADHRERKEAGIKWQNNAPLKGVNALSEALTKSPV
jgi:hypothetical protein